MLCIIKAMGGKMKQCSKCKKKKDESKFSKDRYRKEGLRYLCKDCDRAYRLKRCKKEGKGLKKYYRYEECHRVVDRVKQKRCRRCKRWKAENQYYKYSKPKDGLAVWCKECANKATNKARNKRLAIRN
jgi:hypothetical protein